ncbi:MAG TPA: diguanylate cyclase [Gammaproteobacteria bacterium]
MPDRKAPTHYCDSYGFDADWRQARLDLLGLSAEDAALGERLRERIIRPRVAAIVDAFYVSLAADREAQQTLAHADMGKLKASQTDYLLGFGAGFHTQDYFEERLRIGLVHAWVGVSLGLYLCAYQLMQAQILLAIDQCETDERMRRALCAFVYRIGALDTSLASEIYHIAQMRHLESSVVRLRDERSRLRVEAGTDALTGLANRSSLLPRLTQALAAAVRNGRPLCLIMADLDRFKEINDSYGHPVGDLVLRDTAVRLGSTLRDFDLVARYGGEEFIAVLLDTPLEIAVQIAERVRRRIGGHPYQVIEGGLRVTISQGIALAHAGDSVESLIARADAELYAAKQAGRDCVRVADDPERV